MRLISWQNGAKILLLICFVSATGEENQKENGAQDKVRLAGCILQIVSFRGVYKL